MRTRFIALLTGLVLWAICALPWEIPVRRNLDPALRNQPRKATMAPALTLFDGRVRTTTPKVNKYRFASADRRSTRGS